MSPLVSRYVRNASLHEGQPMIHSNWNRRTIPGARFLLALAAGPARGGAPGKSARPADEAAVRHRTHEFLKALAGGNAREVAAFWTPTGEYHREELTIRGRSNIEKAYAEHLKKKQPPKSILVQDD